MKRVVRPATGSHHTPITDRQLRSRCDRESLPLLQRKAIDQLRQWKRRSYGKDLPYC